MHNRIGAQIDSPTDIESFLGKASGSRDIHDQIGVFESAAGSGLRHAVPAQFGSLTE